MARNSTHEPNPGDDGEQSRASIWAERAIGAAAVVAAAALASTPIGQRAIESAGDGLRMTAVGTIGMDLVHEAVDIGHPIVKKLVLGDDPFAGGMDVLGTPLR